jgi:7,8-dihydropterin-6-yl-methyl-4-(beta-D-ribofuranosyl)aminobenzene 5'-phosphate synthase
VAGLRPFDVQHLIAGHCTGWRAVHALANAYGDRVSLSTIGTSYRFAAAAGGPPQAGRR